MGQFMGISIFQTLAMLIPTFILLYVIFAIVDPLLNDLLEPTITGSATSISILIFDLIILLFGFIPIILIALSLRPTPQQQVQRF